MLEPPSSTEIYILARLFYWSNLWALVAAQTTLGLLLPVPGLATIDSWLMSFKATSFRKKNKTNNHREVHQQNRLRNWLMYCSDFLSWPQESQVCHASSLCFSTDGSKIIGGFPFYLRAGAPREWNGGMKGLGLLGSIWNCCFSHFLAIWSIFMVFNNKGPPGCAYRRSSHVITINVDVFCFYTVPRCARYWKLTMVLSLRADPGMDIGTSSSSTGIAGLCLGESLRVWANLIEFWWIL